MEEIEIDIRTLEMDKQDIANKIYAMFDYDKEPPYEEMYKISDLTRKMQNIDAKIEALEEVYHAIKNNGGTRWKH